MANESRYNNSSVFFTGVPAGRSERQSTTNLSDNIKTGIDRVNGLTNIVDQAQSWQAARSINSQSEKGTVNYNQAAIEAVRTCSTELKQIHSSLNSTNMESVENRSGLGNN